MRVPDVEVTIAREDPSTEDSRALLAELSSTLAAITGDTGKASFDPDDVRVPGAAFVVARSAHGVATGCGAIRPLAPDVAELKRMYARPGHTGTGTMLLKFLEHEAVALGYARLWLETRVVNHQAVRFYERNGFHRIGNFGKYHGNPDAVCFEKILRPITV